MYSAVNIQDFAKGLEAGRRCWNDWVKTVLKVNLDQQQKEILEAIQYERRVSVRSGTARGKDFVAAVASLCFLYLTPEFVNGDFHSAKVVNTAPTGRQVKNIMIPEITKLFHKGMLPGDLMADGIRFTSLGFKDWFLAGFKAGDENIEAWSGLHAPNLMVVVTEASGISQSTFDAIEGILQGNSRLVLVFNPNRTSGESYASTKSKLYKSFKLNCLESPNVRAKKIIIPGQVDYEWVAEKIEKGWALPISKAEMDKSKYDFEFEGKAYRPNDLFRVKVLGEFPEEAEDILIPIGWVEHANAKWKQLKESGDYSDYVNNDTLKLGADIAGMGRDMTVLTHRYDCYVDKVSTYAGHGGSSTIHMKVAGMINNILSTKKGYALIDTIGEGAGVLSRLHELGIDNAVSCKGSYHAKGLRDTTGQYKFLNLRAYMFWALREALNTNNPESLALPPDEELMQELCEIRWEFTSDGKIKIEAKDNIKERLGRSPDKADSLAYSYFPDKRLPISRTEVINPSDYGIY